MATTYQDNRALEAAEKLLVNMGKELERVRQLGLDDVAELYRSIEIINRYDLNVQKIICSVPALQDAWDSFRVLYEMTASKELFETAKEKIAGKKDGTCHGCNRPYRERRDVPAMDVIPLSKEIGA